MNKRNIQQGRRKKNGFTMIELLVVIVIIGLLSAIVVVNVLPNQDTAMVRTTEAQIGQLSSAIKQYKLDMLTYPTTEQGLEALVEAPDGLRNPERYRRGGYMESLPIDPWGNAYQYLYPGENGEFDIFSYGADGREGGEGLNADIVSWRKKK